MRLLMNQGNRLFMGKPGGGFDANQLGIFIQRSGWSWGCSAFDWDNDGYPDVYIVNGHESRQLVKEYEPQFWLHDIYVGNSKEDPIVNAYFKSKFGRTRGCGWSYGGYEKNRLFLNQQGKSFLEIGHLLGVAVEADSRNLVTGDLDGDGRMDIIFTTYEAWPRVRQTVRVYHNQMEDHGNWIGFRFREQGNGISPVGAAATIYYDGKSVSRSVITGDSHRSQHANILHFGLGKSTNVDRVEIQWQNRQKKILINPQINCYQRVLQKNL
jgi:hypothetical protein